MFGDPTRLTQLLTNLISNRHAEFHCGSHFQPTSFAVCSLKFTNKGEVVVSVKDVTPSGHTHPYGHAGSGFHSFPAGEFDHLPSPLVSCFGLCWI